MYNMDKAKKHIKLVGTMTLGPKGQVVIPADVREKMGVTPGTKMVALFLPDKKVVSFVAESQMQEIIDQMAVHVDVLRDQMDQ